MPSQIDMPDFFTTEQLAEYINVPVRTVEGWRNAHRIPGAVRCGRIWRFRRTDVERRLVSGNFLLPKARS